MAWFFTRIAVSRAGGKAVRIKPSTKKIPEFDALIIGGGADVNPELYGEEPLKKTIKKEKKKSDRTWLCRLLDITIGFIILLFRKVFSLGHTAPVDPKRDKLENTMLEKALENGKPILGICRGAQLINIYFGGNLHQELSGYYAESPRFETIYPRKKITIEEGSLLHRIVNKQGLMVNSLHNQAVNQTGKGISICAREETGVVQAIESPSQGFLLGVQWHPEYLPQSRTHQLIFMALVRESKGK